MSLAARGGAATSPAATMPAKSPAATMPARSPAATLSGATILAAPTAPAVPPHRPGARAGVLLRRAHPGDADAVRAMLERTSPESRYRRFFSATPRIRAQLVHRLVDLERFGGLAVLAVAGDDVIGIAHLGPAGQDGAAEIAVLVEDGRQGRGLGRALTEWIVDAARARGTRALTGTVLRDNLPALALVDAVLPGARKTYDGIECSFHRELAASCPPLSA